LNSGDSYLLALDCWLRMEKDYGMLRKKYDYRVPGKIPAASPPRWV
jgi:hypothetical protein